jgi:cobaltochelatase CobS
VTLEGTHHALFPTLVQAAELREPILLSGPAGSGKSTAGKKLADMLGLSFGYIGQTNMPHIVVGSMHPIDKTYRHTAFTNAFINGGVIMLEEMDAWNPNASLVINPPLANRWLTLENGEQYEQHKDCIIIACANTWGTGATAEYVGRNKLDAAFLDRFGVKLHWGYDMDLEIAACGNLEVARAVQMARYNAERYGIKVVISPRSSITIAKMVRAGIDMKAAMEMNFLATVDDNTKRKLLEDVNV